MEGKQCHLLCIREISGEKGLRRRAHQVKEIQEEKVLARDEILEQENLNNLPNSIPREVQLKCFCLANFA
jgi:hypothetical protein